MSKLVVAAPRPFVGLESGRFVGKRVHTRGFRGSVKILESGRVVGIDCWRRERVSHSVPCESGVRACVRV